MSHFSTIKTKIKDKDVLIKALNTLNYATRENVLLVNPTDHDHQQWNVEVALNDFVGFKRAKDGTLQLVAELDAWKESIPVERFLEKVTQAYAREQVVETVQDKGYVVVSEQKSVDNTIELVVEKW
tara:strand:- start:300 stop:677 length:378 start_codon:yes stop_codon:yes gene_type:complete